MNTRPMHRAVISVGCALFAIIALLATNALQVAAQTGAPSASSASIAPALEGAKLLGALREGGYIIYFRHTSTDFGANDDNMTSFTDCAKQRNLTEQGRAEAHAIGAVIGSLAIPIGDVLASPYCRTMEVYLMVSLLCPNSICRAFSSLIVGCGLTVFAIA